MAGRVVYWSAVGDMVAGVIVNFYGWLQGPAWLTIVGSVLVLSGAITLLATRSMRT